MNIYYKILIANIGSENEVPSRMKSKREQVQALIYLLNTCHFANLFFIHVLLYICTLMIGKPISLYFLVVLDTILLVISLIIHFYYLITKGYYKKISRKYGHDMNIRKVGKKYFTNYLIMTLILFVLVVVFSITRSIVLKQ
jgi:uncharacterized membrane protein YeiB